MATTPTRRAMLGAAGLAIAAVALPAAASTFHRGAGIEQHWQDRAQAYRESEADPIVLDNDERSQSYWARIDAAEAGILASRDTSARANEIRLWTAWSHTDRVLAVAIEQGDVATLLPRFASLDWHEQLLFTAILALRGEARS